MTDHYSDLRYEDSNQADIALCESEGITMQQLFLERQEPIFQFFRYSHLPPHLQTVSQMFHHVATRIIQTTPQNAERTVALRKTLEAKDAAVRSVLMKRL